MDRTQYMPGLVDGLVGSYAGDRRRINVDFPQNIRGEGASMSGECLLLWWVLWWVWCLLV